MPPKCESPCEDHKKVFLSVCAFYCGVLVIMIGYLVSNDNRARAEETRIVGKVSELELSASIQHREMMEKTVSQMNLGFSEIRQRLTRIETKVEKP